MQASTLLTSPVGQLVDYPAMRKTSEKIYNLFRPTSAKDECMARLDIRDVLPTVWQQLVNN
jgi:hypothetical protein